MAWNKPDIPNMPDINKPKIFSWLMGFGLYILFVFSLIWFNRNNLILWDNFFAYIGLLILLFVLMLSIRIYVYFLRAREYPRYWAEEVEKVNQRWQVWANESIAVIDSYFLMPNNITAQDITTATAKVYKDEVLMFNERDKSHYYLEQLSLQLIEVLSQQTHHKIELTLVANQDVFDNIYLINRIELMLQEQLAPYLADSNVPLQLIDFSQQQLINQLIDQQDETTHTQLIIVYNLDNPNSSEFIGYFLLAPQAVVVKHDIKVKGSLLRLLVTDELNKAVNQLVEMQPVVTQIRNIWLPHSEVNQALILLLQKLSAQTAENPPLPEQQKLELYLGQSSSLSHWLALHFACEMVDGEQTTELVISQLADKTLFNTVVPENERIRL